ncbi:MAG: glycosyltransferase [Singulisphaera sp.]
MSATTPTVPARSETLDRPARALERREGWVHVCNGLDPVRDGGMVPSILGMTGALAARGGPVTIVTPTPSRLEETPIPLGLTIRGPETDLEAVVRSAGLLHMHGLWQAHTRRGARVARRAGVPYLIAAHGMAEPWAMRHKAWKKKIYTALIEGKNLRRAACLHALSRPEIGHLRAIAPRTPVCFIPNGVNLEPFDDLPGRTALEAERPELTGKFLLLFFGRIHVKKGLDLLAGALSRLHEDHPNLHILIAGNDDGALEPFLDRVADEGLSGRVTCVGHVSGERARQVWGPPMPSSCPATAKGSAWRSSRPWRAGSPRSSPRPATCAPEAPRRRRGAIVVGARRGRSEIDGLRASSWNVPARPEGRTGERGGASPRGPIPGMSRPYVPGLRGLPMIVAGGPPPDPVIL